MRITSSCKNLRQKGNLSKVSKTSLAKSINCFNQKDRHLVERDPFDYSVNTPRIFSSIRKTVSMSDLYEADETLIRKCRSVENLSEPHRCQRNFFFWSSQQAFSKQYHLVRERLFRRSYNEYQFNKMSLELKRKFFVKNEISS